jgi:hypothetical protein
VSLQLWRQVVNRGCVRPRLFRRDELLQSILELLYLDPLVIQTNQYTFDGLSRTPITIPMPYVELISAVQRHQLGMGCLD